MVIPRDYSDVSAACLFYTYCSDTVYLNYMWYSYLMTHIIKTSFTQILLEA